MSYMLITALCYTICTVSDKFTISKYDLNGNEFTFLISASSCILMILMMFFTDFHISFSAGSILTVIFLCADKIAELVTSTYVLKKLSGFETKAWLGTAMFLSYFSDILFFDEKFRAVKLLFIFIVCICLYLMVKDKDHGKGKYKGIMFYLIIYIFSKYFYGLIIRIGSGYISPNVGIYSALLILTIIYFFRIDRRVLFGEKVRGSLIVSLTRIPNVVGLVCENILIGKSLTLYSMVQPVILAMLLIWSFIRHEGTSRKSIVIGAVCLAAIFTFRLI